MKEFEWVAQGYGIPMVQLDGFCCAVVKERLYKRCIFKGSVVDWGRNPCDSSDILCLDRRMMDWQYRYWCLAERYRVGERYLWEAYDRLSYLNDGHVKDGTYELLGFSANKIAQDSGRRLFKNGAYSNPYGLTSHVLVKHDMLKINNLRGRDFDSIREYLESNYIKGIVFWLNGEPKCKIRRRDFGLSWGEPTRRREARMAILNILLNKLGG